MVSNAPVVAEKDRALLPGNPSVAGQKGARSWKRGDEIAGTLLTAPSMVLFTIFVLIPMLGGVVLSFFDWDLFGRPSFAGLDNFRKMLDDARLAKAAVNTGLFVVLGMVPTIILGFLCANLINSSKRIMQIARVAYFMPIVVSSAVAGVLWSLIYRPQYGLISGLASFAGIDQTPSWLTDTAWALPALEFFNAGPAISTGAQIPWLGYVLPALGYCMLYSGAALLFAFLLFEDRDLA